MPLTEDQLVRRFAPLLRFRDDERHLPGEPEEFRRMGRFRESNFAGRQDRGWNRVSGAWQEGSGDGPDFLGTTWTTILAQIAQVTGRATASLDPDGAVTRPRDARNLWRDRDGTRGFFLELTEGFGRASSGSPGPPVPTFYDVSDQTDTAGGRWIGLSYWAFYVFNWNAFPVAQHEGDWEHITLYFPPDAYAAGERPSVIFYASHNDGFLVSGQSPAQYVEDTHPIVFVLPSGHPSHPIVADPHRYDRQWRTWQHPILRLADQDWARYDGAWGEVGALVHTTGPLGPWFKRGRDKLKVRTT